ncbi:acyl-CoA dehydrogenase [bacterium CPR1]|nr:acyl-CoA dehydrogenase [bacterium CPR1]
MSVSVQTVPGGNFLVEESSPKELFTPDELSEEHRMIMDTARRFMLDEVMPKAEQLEKCDLELLVKLLKKSGELGLLGAEIPEEYGGMGLDLLSSMLISEEIGRLASWSVSVGGHAGIGTYPVLYFGNEEQRKKWLPLLATGELISSYGLTEPHSGSDALAARTKAELSEDGQHYILNGSKMWITNAGFADLMMVFAKVDGTQFSCFIVDTKSPGFTLGAEEKKLGLKGSSTRGVTLENVKVPRENLVGEVGKGHKIALNVLNIGRFKLGAWCISGSKFALNDAIKYAKERTQFGKHLAEFGALQEKFGQMVTLIWVGESMNYRTAGLIEKALTSVDKKDSQAVLRGIEEYAAECAILKVWGSEALDYVVDECVQIFGGYGYSQEYPAERPYRDSRINRIFEGTNEINRLTITGTLLKRTMSGRLNLMDALVEVQKELEGGVSPAPGTGPLAREKTLVQASKSGALLCAGVAINAIGMDSPEEKHQEALMRISDLVMEVFAQESAWLRCQKLIDSRGEDKVQMQIDITRTYVNDSVDKVRRIGRNLLATVSEGEALEESLEQLDRLLKHTPINTVRTRRRIAERVLEAGRYQV